MEKAASHYCPYFYQLKKLSLETGGTGQVDDGGAAVAEMVAVYDTVAEVSG